jgi:hypothetical protein
LRWHEISGDRSRGLHWQHLVDRLLASGDTVVGYDNLSSGFTQFLSSASTSP